MRFWKKIWPEEGRDRLMLLLAMIVAILTGYFLFFYQPEFRDPKDAIQVGSLKTGDSVRIRHAKSLRWGTIKKQGTIYLKDMVYTPAGNSAEFFWKDKKIILEPESLVQFDEATLDNLEITLLDGKIKADPETAKFFAVVKPRPKTVLFKRNEVVYLPDINPFIIKHSELSARTMDKLAKKLVFEPERGVISPKLYLNELTDYQVVVKKPLAKLYRFSQNGWFPFEWMEIPLKDVTYRIEVGVEQNFKEAVATPTKSTFLQVLFEQPGTYYWRVIAERKLEIVQTGVRPLTLSLTEGQEANVQRVLTSKDLPQSAPPKTELMPLGRANGKNKIKSPKEKSPFEILFGK